MSAIAGDLTKWRARKVRGSWEVARPTQINSVIAFESFTEMLAWHPDCTRFLRGWCWCRDECHQ
jgi:hypothetical protein